MASVDQNDFPELYNVLEEMGYSIIDNAEANLKKKKKRKYVRAKWEDGKPIEPEIRYSKPRASYNTGETIDGLGVKLIPKGGSFIIHITDANGHAESVDKGRRPFVKNFEEGNKGIPPAKMNSWIKSRGIKPRDLKTGQFIPIDEKGTQIRRMAFLMNRKIKWFGIEPTNFLTDARRDTEDEYQDRLIEAYEEDIRNQFT
jgi:hypothetical protein